MILNRLKSLASNVGNPNLFLGTTMAGFYVEEANTVLYVHKCVKVDVKIAVFPCCTEKFLVDMDNTTNYIHE